MGMCGWKLSRIDVLSVMNMMIVVIFVNDS